MDVKPREITLLLGEWRDGDASAMDRLTPLVYAELRRIAASHLRNEPAGHTLQPTALVHEAYLRLVDQHSARLRDRTHFLSLAARMMRRILIDHARARSTVRKGGGDAVAVTLSEEIQGTREEPAVELLALNEALGGLAAIDARAAAVVELRFFGGLTNQEIAEIQGVSLATVKRDWEFARAWLRWRLDSGDSRDSGDSHPVAELGSSADGTGP